MPAPPNRPCRKVVSRFVARYSSAFASRSPAMRLLTTLLLVSLAGSLAVAADKDEDKAKEAVTAFLKALKSKDVDAVMKTVDVPFFLEGKDGVIDKTDDLKSKMKTFLEKVEPDKLQLEIGKTLDVAAIRKLFEGKDDKKSLENVEKVLGKTGYAVFLLRDGKERGAVLVRIKDDKAAVVGIPR